MLSNDADIPDHGTGFLRLQRASLVQQIIDTANGKKQQILLRGAAGTGKTSLLADVARALQTQGKRVIIAADPSMLPIMDELLKQAWQGRQEEKPVMLRSEPLHLIIDEAQQSYSKNVLQQLLKMPPANRNIVIIAAGIPGKEGASAAFTNRIESDKVLLTEDEVCQEDVVQFFLDKLVVALGHAGSTDVVRTATTEVLKFAHYYTAGHTYACLKIAEYCVTHQATACMGQRPREELGRSLGSAQFLETTGRAIFQRCFPSFCDYSAVEGLQNKYMSGSTQLVVQLQEHGLWDKEFNRLLSPLLQFHLFHLMPKLDDFVFTNADQIGDALYHCTKHYKKWKFVQYESGAPAIRDRCEDGAGFFIGCELSKYCLVSPQHAIPKQQPSCGHPPSVDYYLNGRVNMYLELVKNGSRLNEHFDRFISGDYGDSKPFAILDINFTTKEPRELKGKYEEYKNVFYTYVVQTRELYHGMELFKQVILLIVSTS